MKTRKKHIQNKEQKENKTSKQTREVKHISFYVQQILHSAQSQVATPC